MVKKHINLKIKTIALLMLFAISSSCVKTHKKSDTMERVPEIYIKTINNLIGFFDKHAYDPQKLVYYSEIDNEGMDYHILQNCIQII